MSTKLGWLRNAKLLEIAVLSFSFPAAAHAQLSLTASAGMEAHSNVDLRSEDEESDVTRTASAGIGYQHKDDGTASADVAYSFGYEDYLHDIEEDRTTTNGRASGVWHVLPRRLDAIFTHLIEQTLANRREADTADNQDRRSVTTAGLDGFVHFSTVDSLVLSPRFTDVRFKESDQSDSERGDLSVGWNHRLSPVSALDLTASYSHVTFDVSEDDYDLESLMLSYQSRLSRLSYEVGLGGNRIKRDIGDDVSGAMARLSVSYQRENNQSFSASYLHQLTDSSVGLSGAELSLPDFNSNDSNFDQVDIIEIDQFDLDWRIPLTVSNLLTLGVGYSNRDYQDTPQDERLAYASAAYGYTINSRWSLDAAVHFERTEFLDAPETEYDTTTLSVGLTYKASSALDVRFSVGREERDADSDVTSYDDNIAIVRVDYRFF